MTRPPRPRRVRIAACAATLVAAGTVLSACAASAGDLARASCAHVNASISLYERSATATDPVRAKALADKAYLELLAAIPIAAQAAYHDIQWESLSATLSEANRVPESELAAVAAGPVPQRRRLGVRADAAPAVTVGRRIGLRPFAGLRRGSCATARGCPTG